MMFSKIRSPRILEFKPHQEDRLRHNLISDLEENVYLLGLLRDYSLRGLMQMGWGRFISFERDGQSQGTLYCDATGLTIVSGATREAINHFAHYCLREAIPVTRIISKRDQAEAFHDCYFEHHPHPLPIRNVFPEQGMILDPAHLSNFREAGLKLAAAEDSRDVALGSARAMEEELGVKTAPEEIEKLVRSKVDLIERGRYFVYRLEGQIAFQAYLSASLPEMGQIQGVWVPPEFRNVGVATRCLGEMCERCFRTHRRLILRVQERNAPALGVYRKLGFADAMDYLSVWYGT